MYILDNFDIIYICIARIAKEFSKKEKFASAISQQLLTMSGENQYRVVDTHEEIPR